MNRKKECKKLHKDILLKDILLKYFILKILKITVVAAVLIYTCSVFDNAAANSSTSESYKTVCVNYGDTVWSIAAKNTNNHQDVRDTIAIIKKLNKLSNDVTVQPGQILKIPVGSNE